MDACHSVTELHERRERVFLVLAGIFLGCMTMLNILGITRFVHIGPMALAVGVLPYPLTFLCTDFISEFYGRRRANFVVWVGLLLNVVLFVFLWMGHQLPGISETVRPAWLETGSWNPPPWQTLELAQPMSLPLGGETNTIDLFELIYLCTYGSVVASMVAYIAAQFCDVYLFHLWKKVTKGKHLWIRNNGSTMISQLIDATTVVFIVFWAPFSSGEKTLKQMLVLVGSNYFFKLVVAAADTIPFYVGVRLLSRYLSINPLQTQSTSQEAQR